MLSIWVKDKNIWLLGRSNKRKIKKNDTIIREEKLGDISRRLISSGPFESLALVRGEDYCAAALRRGSWIYPIQIISPQKQDQKKNIYYPEKDIIDSDVIGSDEALSESLCFDEILEQIHNRENSFAEILPENSPALPKEILEKCSKEDEYGIYGETSYWWWQSRTGTLHIIGSGKADGFAQSESGTLDDKYSPLTILLMLMIDLDRLRKLIVHEGITRFRGFDFMYYGQYMNKRNRALSEVILPSSLAELDCINCYTEKLKIPESIRELNMFFLVNDMGGHWDPVTYCARTIMIPSSATIIEGIPYLEPIHFLENMEIYGDQPIKDLDNWLSEGMLNTNPETKIRITYPSEWDQGNPGSYADKIMDFMSTKELCKPDWSQGNNMYLPVVEDEWNQEDFKEWIEYIQPKQQDKNPSVSETQEKPFLIKYLPNGNVQFGHYSQGGKSVDPIEWRILEENDSGMLLLSQYGLDLQPYDIDESDISWEACYMRKWLNETFINEAFTEEEKELILSTEIQSVNLTYKGMIPGLEIQEVSNIEEIKEVRKTEDKLFLLSEEEAYEYLEPRYTLECEPTAYAVRQGVSVDAYLNNCNWWLRSNFEDRHNYLYYVYYSGHIFSGLSMEGWTRRAVRPAMWVSFDS